MKKTLTVGIVSAPSITIDFGCGYRVVSGVVTFSTDALGRLTANGTPTDNAEFEALGPDSAFTVADVTIGINFHWERREDQRFHGDCLLKVIAPCEVVVINRIDVELYLKSVISSEMSATASLELLKAHAVISRSWVLAQIENHNSADSEACIETDSPDCLIKWYDHSDHTLFDVCADDHCQRYQGITRQTTPTVEEAVNLTAGEVLISDDGQLCDARFSKCCGGVFEEFQNCWQPTPKSYLCVRRDGPNPTDYPDLRIDSEATGWILSSPEAFCNTDDSAILGQVLNGYDQETADFYRWKVSYDRDTLKALVAERTGIDFGDIIALEPLERGTSGRIVRLRIVGTRHSRIIGKELEIRRSLSRSHLYSSAFVVEAMPADADGIPAGFTLHGAGWGHGVGLCQIGAAVMAERGYDYRRILAHYFPGSRLQKL